MKRLSGLLLCGLVCVLCFGMEGGAADAGPFRRLKARRLTSCNPSPWVLTSWPESSPFISPSAGSRVTEQPAPLPLSPISVEDDSSSPRQGTALEAVEGTGSLLPIGKSPLPKEIPIKLDPAAIAAIKDACKQVAASLPQKLEVPITLPLAPETSERLSRISTILEWLLLLGGGIFGGSAIGRLIQWARPLVGGLLSTMKGPSSGPGLTREALLSALLKELQEGKAAGESSTPKAGS